MTELEKQEILTWIRAEHAAKRPLNLHAVKRRRPELIKRVYGTRPFWGWWRAITDAGLDYGDLVVELEETVQCRVCGFEGRQIHGHLFRRHGIKTGEYREKFPGAETASEQHRAKMKKDGGNHLLPHWEPLYSDEYMMDRAFRYHEMGHRLRSTWIVRNDHNLWQHVHRQGIMWERFVKDLGIPWPEAITQGPRQTAAEVLDGLRELVREEGETPKVARLIELNQLLHSGVRRYFDSYDAALEAAGLPLPNRPFPLRREYVEEEVLAELRELNARGTRVTDIGIKNQLGNRDLHLTIVNMGGYPRVREKLGIEKPPAIRAEVAHTREEAIEALRLRSSEGKPLYIPTMRKGPDADPELLRSGKHHFGRWIDFMKAAGITPVHHAVRRAGFRRKALIDAIQARHQKGESLVRVRMKEEPDSAELYYSAKKTFQSWKRALLAAGLQ